MYVYYDYDVRILTMCSCDVRIFRRRTSSIDVRIIRHVRIFLAYAFYRRTHIATTYFDDAHTCFPAYVSYQRTCLPATCVSTHVFNRRTSAIDVRVLPAYVVPRWMISGLRSRGSRFGTTLLSRGFGTTLLDRGVGTTENTLDLMRKIPLAPSGLRLAPKIYH